MKQPAADSFDHIRARLKEIREAEGRTGEHPMARKMSYPASNHAPCDTETDGWVTYTPEENDGA